MAANRALIFADIPAEIVNEILKTLIQRQLNDAEHFTQNILDVTRTSKDFHTIVTRYLRNPTYLLQILNVLPPSQMNPFFNTFFSPTSDNYKAIKLASEDSRSSTIDHTRICFALMRDDVKISEQSEWDEIKQSIENLKKNNTLSRLECFPEGVNLSRIEISLRLAVQLYAGVDIWGSLGEDYIKLHEILKSNNLLQSYINLSGLDLRHILGCAPGPFSFPLSSHFLLDLNPEMFRYANFRKSNLAGVDMKTALLEGTSFIQADLTGADFSKAKPKGADFRMAILKDGTATEPKPSFTFNPSNPSAAGYRPDFDNSRPRRAPAMHAQLKFDDIIDLEKLCKSPQSLTRHLSYLNSIVFEDSFKSALRRRVLFHLLRLENSAANIDLLEAAKPHSFFAYAGGVIKVLSDIGSALFSSPIKTEDQRELGLRITAFKKAAPASDRSPRK